MSEPAWVAEAMAKCVVEAEAYKASKAALQALSTDAPTNDFVDAYEQLLEARDRLYDAWISQEMDA